MTAAPRPTTRRTPPRRRSRSITPWRPARYANALAVTGINLNGATVADVAGNAANFAGANATFLAPAGRRCHHAHHDGGACARSVGRLGVGVARPGRNRRCSRIRFGRRSVRHAECQRGRRIGRQCRSCRGRRLWRADARIPTAATPTPTRIPPRSPRRAASPRIFSISPWATATAAVANATLTVLITSPGETYVAAASGGTIAAGNGAYVLDGSAGNVTETAGGGAAQWLIGGPGDTLNAGSTADTFLFEPGFGKVTVNNFNTAHRRDRSAAKPVRELCRRCGRHACIGCEHHHRTRCQRYDHAEPRRGREPARAEFPFRGLNGLGQVFDLARRPPRLRATRQLSTRLPSPVSSEKEGISMSNGSPPAVTMP